MDSMQEKQRKTCVYDKHGNCQTPNCPFKHDPPRKVADNTFGIEEKETEDEKKARLARLGQGRGRGASILPAWMTSGTTSPSLGFAPNKTGGGGAGPESKAPGLGGGVGSDRAGISSSRGQQASSATNAHGGHVESRNAASTAFSGRGTFPSASQSMSPERAAVRAPAPAPMALDRNSFTSALYSKSNTAGPSGGGGYSGRDSLNAPSAAYQRDGDVNTRGGPGGKVSNLNAYMHEQMNGANSYSNSKGGGNVDGDSWAQRSIVDNVPDGSRASNAGKEDPRAYVPPSKDIKYAPPAMGSNGRYVPPERPMDRDRDQLPKNSTFDQPWNNRPTAGTGMNTGPMGSGMGNGDDRYPAHNPTRAPGSALNRYPGAGPVVSASPDMNRVPPDGLDRLGFRQLSDMCAEKGLRVPDPKQINGASNNANQIKQLVKVCVDRLRKANECEASGIPRAQWPTYLFPKENEYEYPSKKQRADNFSAPTTALVNPTTFGLQVSVHDEEEKIARLRAKEAMPAGRGRGRGVSILPAWMSDPGLAGTISSPAPAPAPAAAPAAYASAVSGHLSPITATVSSFSSRREVIELGEVSDDEGEEEDIFKIASSVAESKNRTASFPTAAASTTLAEQTALNFLDSIANNLDSLVSKQPESNHSTSNPTNPYAHRSSNTIAPIPVDPVVIGNLSKRKVSNLPAWMTNKEENGSVPAPVPSQYAAGLDNATGQAIRVYSNHNHGRSNSSNNEYISNYSNNGNNGNNGNKPMNRSNSGGSQPNKKRPYDRKSEYDMMQELFENA